MNAEDIKIYDEFVEAMNNKYQSLSDVNDDREYKKALYQIWGNNAGAQHTLLSAYIMAHAFLFFSTISLFLAFAESLKEFNSVGILLFLALTLMCVIGKFLSYQMHCAWQRSVKKMKFLQEEIRKCEASKKSTFQLFTEWPKYNDINDEEDQAKESIRARFKKFLSGRAHTLAYVFGIFYFIVFVMSLMSLTIATT